MEEPSVALNHPQFRSAWASVFTRRFVSDCMTHQCKMVEAHTGRPDVCCQYGCDVDLLERAEIEARRDPIAALMRAEAKHARWFELEETVDADFPSGRVVRSEVFEGGCIFLAHDRRGCAIHRAALENGWNLRGIKPAVCRLFPLTWIGDEIVVAEEFPEYSCAHVEGPTVYRTARDALADIFGEPLIVAMDAAEAQVLAAAQVPGAGPRRLPVTR